MVRVCRWVVVGIVLVLASLAISARPAAATGRPVVMLLHGGGFIFDDGSQMAVATELAGQLGFDVAYVDYPLFDLPGAIAAAKERARELRRRDREVVAYGDSAGGTLAALLAQQGLVDAAATYSPIADMRVFVDGLAEPAQYVENINANGRVLRRASPDRRATSKPILAMRAGLDRGPSARQVRRWARADPRVAFRAVPGVHAGALQPALYARNAAEGLRWLLHHG